MKTLRGKDAGRSIGFLCGSCVETGNSSAFARLAPPLPARSNSCSKRSAGGVLWAGEAGAGPKDTAGATFRVRRQVRVRVRARARGRARGRTDARGQRISD